MDTKHIITENEKRTKYTFLDQFEITGEIIWKRRTEKSLSYVIRTMNPITRAVDNPLITIYENIEAFDEMFSLHDRVTARGYVQTTKTSPDVILATTSMNEELSEFDAVTQGLTFKPDCNIVALQGKVANDVYSPRPNLAMVRVRVVSANGFAHFPSIVGFDKLSNELKKVTKDDYVKVLCRARVSRISPKDGNGKPTNRRSLVIQSLEILTHHPERQNETKPAIEKKQK